MKIIAAIAAITLFMLTQTCNTQNQNTSTMEISGTIEAIQMSTWQYATHKIENDTTFFALKSDKVDLGKYESKFVTIIAEKIDGYPVDGGPEFLEVTEVEE